MLKRFKQSLYSSTYSGAVFLMATSAIGPGFLTQTTVFTSQLLASMGFVILCSILIDIIVQLNIWQTLTAHRKKASTLANDAVPGSGHLLTIMIGFGGFAFNIGNLAGAGMGLSLMLPVTVEAGVMISAGISILLFASKNAQSSMDVFVKALGIMMLAMMFLVVFYTNPPLKEILYRSIAPEKISFTAIIALVGGTVGGYISFAGAHRLLDSNQPELLTPKRVQAQAIKGILLTGCMRVLLFLAVAGVVYNGFMPGGDNPAASVFQHALGEKGMMIFGIILWSASITSVVGAAYTSVSFLETLHRAIPKYNALLRIGFVAIAGIIFLLWGKPVNILVMAGVINGFILPFALALILFANQRGNVSSASIKPWLIFSGWAVVMIMLAMSVRSLME